MNDKEKDKSFSKSDFELSGDESNESTQLTDGTLGLSNLDFDDDNLNLGDYKVGKNIIENKQLLHDLQIQKIELSQKDVLLNSIKYEYESKNDSLQEKLNDALHHNNVLENRINHIISVNNEENQRRQEQIKVELSRIILRQKELEDNNIRFMKHESDLKKDLRNIEISDEDYVNLAKRDEDLITIKEFVSLKFYNTIKPLKTKINELTKTNKELEESLIMNRNELIQTKQDLDDEKRKHHLDAIEAQKVYYELADARSLLQQANFKKDNYDRVKYERDEFERKSSEAETNLSSLNATLKVISKERDELYKDVSQFKQEIMLLKQDKEYLHRQFVESQNKQILTDNKLEQVITQYEDVKRAREEIYEKYINSKEIYKNEYDTKLSQELEQLRNKTEMELERLKSNTKEFYERENRALRESRDIALHDKEKVESNEKDLNRRLNELMNELRTIQLNNDNKLNEVKSDLKLKLFELERANLLQEEHANNLRKSLLDNEKLSKKVEVLQNEYYALQIQNEKNYNEIENELNEKSVKLKSYEKLEHEMDEVILQAAESENTGDAEKMLFSYGYGANIVTSAKRRIQQNVHLTRRILHLEKINTSLRHEIERERNKSKEIGEELSIHKNVIDQAKQPQEYVIRSIQSKEMQNKKQKNTIEILQQKINELEAEKSKLISTQNEMTSDIERLIRHNEELFAIREELQKNGIVLNLNRQNKLTTTTKYNKSKIIANSLEALTFDQPEPMMFTKLKQKQLQPSITRRRSPENQKKVYTIDKN